MVRGLQIFQLEEAIGEFNSEELSEGKLPRLISLIAQMNIPGLPKLRVKLNNIQFDFKRPMASTKSIVLALMKGVRFSKKEDQFLGGIGGQLLDDIVAGF